MNITIYITTVSRRSVLWLFWLVQPKTILSFRNQCSGNTSLVLSSISQFLLVSVRSFSFLTRPLHFFSVPIYSYSSFLAFSLHSFFRGFLLVFFYPSTLLATSSNTIGMQITIDVSALLANPPSKALVGDNKTTNKLNALPLDPPSHVFEISGRWHMCH